jgi:hypothetical protein
MPAPTTHLFLVQDLEDSSRTSELTDRDRKALHAVADWITTFVARPNKDLGRAGPVCPFVPGALDHKTLWLAPEQIASRSVLDVVHRVNGYKSLFLRTHPLPGDDATSKAIVVVFTDVSAERAKEAMDAVLEQLAASSYVEDGVVLGAFYERNEATAIYNPSFRPFTPPVPFLLMRPTVITDWKFFVDNEDWLNKWARRFGASAVQALAEELRRTNWRQIAS